MWWRVASARRLLGSRRMLGGMGGGFRSPPRVRDGCKNLLQSAMESTTKSDCYHTIVAPGVS